MDLPATSEALRHSLAAIGPGLKDFVLPSGPFDAAGSWTHDYRIYSVMRAPANTIGGHLKISRTARPDGARLEVEQLSLMTKQYGYACKASIQCAADRWSTPRCFSVETWTTTPAGQLEAGSRLQYAAEVVSGEICFSGMRKPSLRVAADWTLDWALFDALQRLPSRESGDLQLDVVEDCDLLRREQRVNYAGPLTAKVGDKTTELYAFCRLGTARLPILYWFDRQHRLLFAIHDFRAFILQSGTQQEKGK